MSELIAFITNSLTLTTLLAYIFGLWATIVIWTWFDVSSRTGNLIFRFGSIIIVATGFIFGLAIYLILRPDLTKEEKAVQSMEDSMFVSQASVLLCPNCYSTIKDDFVFCSTCAFKLQTSCKNCSKKINVSWFVCPFCGFKNDNMIKGKSLNEIPQAKEPKLENRPKGKPILAKALHFLLNPYEKNTQIKLKEATKTNETNKSKTSKAKRQSKRKTS